MTRRSGNEDDGMIQAWGRNGLGARIGAQAKQAWSRMVAASRCA